MLRATTCLAAENIDIAPLQPSPVQYLQKAHPSDVVTFLPEFVPQAPFGAQLRAAVTMALDEEITVFLFIYD